jgi:hypothetical protein
MQSKSFLDGSLYLKVVGVVHTSQGKPAEGAVELVVCDVDQCV